MLPPATPPLSSSTSQPGLFTSKDLITKQQNKKILVMTTFYKKYHGKDMIF